MGLFEKIWSQLIDIIEWLDSTNDTIAYRFERFQNEIKMGAKLIVRPGQVAVFVNEGQVADVFEPGTYTLSSQNLPILSTLQGWKYGFNSPFKAEVYFFNTKIFTNLKWGTSNPIVIRDSELGIVRLRAYGNYSFRVINAAQLLRELVSTDGLFQLDEITDHLRNIILTAFASWIGSDATPFPDFAANFRTMGEQIRQEIQAEMQCVGVELTQLLIENISLPPEVQAALDKSASMRVLGNLQQYSQYQVAQALEKSAENPSKGNVGMEFGLGLVMAQEMAKAMSQATSQPAVSAAALSPPPAQPQWYLVRNGQQVGPLTLNQLSQQGLTPQTNIWRQGMTDWQPASALPELASLLPTAPPPPVPSSWYIARAGQQVGPLTLEQLRQQEITPQTNVWRQGMANWQPAAEVAELASLFLLPPPPPA